MKIERQVNHEQAYDTSDKMVEALLYICIT
jgi:hypothetical protein